MSDKYSYRDIAADDFRAAKEMLNVQLFNHSARFCQQYVEKIFKECLTLSGTEESDLFLLHSHKLDTNYPGENYIRLSESKAIEIYNEVIKFKNLHEDKLCRQSDT